MPDQSGATWPWEADDLDGLPPYVPVERADTLIRCQRCGAVVDGDICGQAQHNIWHDSLDRQIADAARWRPPTRFGGAR